MGKSYRKALEQSVVTWEDDASVTRCRFCQQEFSNYIFRRHHCRVCGHVVCGDLSTDCSKEVGLNVAAGMSRNGVFIRVEADFFQVTNQMTEKAVGEISIDVRMCRDCRTTIFKKRDFAFELATKPPDARAYENLVQFERGIRLMLPKFQHLLQTLQ